MFHYKSIFVFKLLFLYNLYGIFYIFPSKNNVLVPTGETLKCDRRFSLNFVVVLEYLRFYLVSMISF